jgi:ribosomal protein S18 acetylase RimI-like enzyme
MIIRPALKKDALTVASLIHMAIGDLAEKFTGAQNQTEAVERLAILFTYDENRFSHQYAYVIEEEHTVVAVASAYSEGIIDALTVTTLALSKSLTWHISTDCLQRLQEDKEAPKGTFYIDHIAVHPKTRGKGYASLLISTLENKAIQSHHDKTSLLVDVDNPKAKKIYEKLGYIPTETVNANGHIYTALVKNLNMKSSN